MSSGRRREDNSGPRAPQRRIQWRRALSWAVYDLANTIYSAIVVSFAIALHVKEFTGVERFTFLTSSASMLASGFFVPFAGALADRTGHSKRYLIVFTVVCVLFCAAIGGALWAPAILFCYFMANFTYNASLTFYDSLLPVVAPRQRIGLVSGLGVGLGYGGVALAMPAAIGVLYLYRGWAPAHELRPLFPLAAALFLAFSLPLFLLVPERRVRETSLGTRRLVALAFSRTMVTIRALPRHKNMLLFLLGNFLCVDAVNATIFCFATYIENVLGVSRPIIMLWTIVFSLSAFGMGVLGGWLSDRFGSRRIMLSAGLSFTAAVVVCAAFVSPWVFFPSFVLLGGYGLANTWVAGRKMLLSLAPAAQIGKYFGLYNVGHKLSIIGTLLFGLLADLEIPWAHAGGYRAGLLVQSVSMAAGILLIWKVKLSDATHGQQTGNG